MSERRIMSGCKFAAAGALLLFSVHAALAQAPDGPPPPTDAAPPGQSEHGQGERGMPNPQRQLGALTRLLNLTADQQKGVLPVLEQQATEMKALREKAPADPSTGQTPESWEARRAQMNQIREEAYTRIAALLDENQKKTFADRAQKRKQEMEKRQRRDGADGPSTPPPQGGAAPPPAQ